MSTRSLYRFSALCLLASCVLSLFGGMAHPIVDGNSHSAESFLASRSPWAQYLIYAGAVFLMLGLPGGYLWFRARLGILGFIGFVGYAVGNALSAMSHLVVEAFVGPTLAADDRARHLIPDSGEIFDADPFITLQVVGGLVFVISLVLIAVAIIRAQGMPTWLGGFLLVGALSVMFPLPEREVFSGLLIELPRGLTVAVLATAILRGTGGADQGEHAELREAARARSGEPSS